MRKPKSISDETKRVILESAWALIAEFGRPDVSMNLIAERAGVSRQTLFYAFGGRPALLLAMVRHKDTTTPHVAQLNNVMRRDSPCAEDLVEFARIWLDYLPHIYPVGILLDAASISDPEAAAAWDDRMKGALLQGFRSLARAVHSQNPLPSDPKQIADAAWALVHPTMYRRFVVDCGWTDAEFRDHQLAMISRMLRGL